MRQCYQLSTETNLRLLYTWGSSRVACDAMWPECWKKGAMRTWPKPLTAEVDRYRGPVERRLHLLAMLYWTGVTQNKVDWVLLYVHRNCRLIRDGNPGRPPRLSLTQLCAKQWEVITGRVSECAFVVWSLQCFDISSPSWGPFFNFDACMSVRWGGWQWLLRTCRRGVTRNKGRSSRGELWLCIEFCFQYRCK